MNDEWDDYDPCPECGSQELDQLVQSWEKLDVDDGGMITHIEKYDEVTTLQIECSNCGEVLFEQ